MKFLPGTADILGATPHPLEEVRSSLTRGGTVSPKVRLAIGATAILVIVVTMARITSQEPPTVVRIGPRNSVSSQWVDGRAVWVVNDGGNVIVLDAVNPHPWWGLSDLVGWCEATRSFEAWWDRSKFDLQGQYMFGPSPRDLDRYPVEDLHGTVARIGDEVTAAGRTRGDSRQGWCRGDGDDNPALPRHHRTPGSRRQLFDGVMVAEPGRAPWFCPGAGGRAGCAQPLHVPQMTGDEQETIVLTGRFLARLDGSALHDVIVLPPPQADAPE